MKKSLEVMEKHSGILSGQIVGIDKDLKVIDKELNELLQKKKYCESKNDNLGVNASAIKAGKRDKAKNNLKDLKKELVKLNTSITRIRRVVATVIDVKEDDIKMYEREYKATKAGYKAMKAASSALKNNAGNDLEAMALQSIQDSIESSLGDIQVFLETAEDVMNNVDIQNGVFEQRGFDTLANLEVKMLQNLKN